MKPALTLLTALLLASFHALHAADANPGVTLERRRLPLLLFNNDSDDLKWPAYREHHASGLWVPAGQYLPLPKINSLADALAPRIGPLAKTKTQGLAYCGNFGVPVWDLKRDHIAALGDDPLQPILQFWKRDGRTFFFSMRMNDAHHEIFNWRTSGMTFAARTATCGSTRRRTPNGKPSSFPGSMAPAPSPSSPLIATCDSITRSRRCGSITSTRCAKPAAATIWTGSSSTGCALPNFSDLRKWTPPSSRPLSPRHGPFSMRRQRLAVARCAWCHACRIHLKTHAPWVSTLKRG